jgi:hypothetical protein
MSYTTKDGVPVTPVAVIEMTGNLAIGRYTTKLEYDVNGNLVYIGIAASGTLTSQPLWFIKKLIWSGTSLTDMQCANGQITFDKTWDLRSTYNYS